MALSLLLLAMVSVEWRHPLMFPWGYASLALTAALLVWALVAAPTGLCSTLLAWPPLVAVGKISYGLYLWHYPLFRVAEAQAPKVGISVPFAMALAACLTVLTAWASYVLVERPLRARLASR